jgi:hypothetical protein
VKRGDEDRILHGLYYCCEGIDEEMRLSAEQILWLAMHPLHEGDSWLKNGHPQSLDISSFHDGILTKLSAAKLELPLRYLQYRRLITLAKRGDSYAVSVTFAGADRAIRLHTRRGRLDLWYRERKDGIVGASVTVLIAFITALITVLLLDWLRH